MSANSVKRGCRSSGWSPGPCQAPRREAPQPMVGSVAAEPVSVGLLRVPALPVMGLGLEGHQRPADVPEHSVLVVGLGQEHVGDAAAGFHLARCLSQLSWPGGVCFRFDGLDLPRVIPQFRHVVLLDCFEGPEGPGALYQAEPDDMLDGVCGSAGLELAASLPPALRQRVSVFGVHPRTVRLGSPMSSEVMSCLPVLLPYLRAFILQLVARMAQVN